jgi:hypothetical protein
VSAHAEPSAISTAVAITTAASGPRVPLPEEAADWKTAWSASIASLIFVLIAV